MNANGGGTDKALLRQLAREIINKERSKAKLTGVTADSGNSIERRDDAWIQPMTAEGDLIVGLESGAPGRLPAGDVDDVLTISALGVPEWQAGGGGSYTDEQAQDAVGSILVPTSSIVPTYTDATPEISFALVDEYVRDLVASFLVAGSGVTVTPDDPGDTITIASTGSSALIVQEEDSTVVGAAATLDFAGAGFNVTDEGSGEARIENAITQYTDEMSRDAIGTALVAGNNIDISVNDLADTITIDVETLTSADVSDFAEATDDRVAALLVAGNNVDLTYNDGAGTLTIDVETLTSVDVTDFSEAVDDRVAALLVAGNNIDLTYNDGAGTLTVDVEQLTSADLSDFTEAAQDATGAMVANSSSVTLSYVDATPSLTAAVVDSYINSLINTLIASIDNSDEVSFNNPANWLFRHTLSIGYNTPAGGSINAFGVVGTLTTQGTAAAADGTDGMWTSFSQSSNTSLCGKSNTFQNLKADWHLTFCIRIKTGSDLTTFRYFIGMSEPFSNAQTTDTPTGDGVWFKRSSAVPDTNWQCVSGDGSARTQTDSGVAIVADTVYEFRAHFGTSKAKFYINDNLVATHDTASSHKLPRTNQNLGIIFGGYTLAASARVVKIGHWMIATVY